MTGPGVVGGALVVERDCVHLAAFATSHNNGGSAHERTRSTMASARLRRRRYEVE
jgi:hypothetical protein